jgi:hypothetical protein
MNKIVGICGYIGSGKDTVAACLKERGYVSMSFADPVKIVLQDLFTIPSDTLWGPSDRRTGEVRRMLQVFGTDFARSFDQDVWVKKLLYRITTWLNTGEDPYNLCPPCSLGERRNIVVPDIRFPNEAKALVDIFGVKIIRVERPKLPETQTAEARLHSSETAHKDIPQEYITTTVLNDGDLEQLREKVNTTIEQLGL